MPPGVICHVHASQAEGAQGKLQQATQAQGSRRMMLARSIGLGHEGEMEALAARDCTRV
jgi:hypothetical protein